MARSVTLSTMITRVRQRTDDESSAARYTDQEITDNLNEGIADLVDVVRGVFGQDYFRSASTFTTVNGTAVYALPADFLSLLSVDIVVNGTMTLSARPYMESERNAYKFFPGGWIYNQPIFYRLTASNITFIPTPPGAYSITLNYQPVSAYLNATFDVNGALTSGGNGTIDGIGGWEEYAVLDAAIKILIKDKETGMIPVLEGRKAEMKDRVQAMAPQRDAGQNERVQDIYRYNVVGGWGGEW